MPGCGRPGCAICAVDQVPRGSHGCGPRRRLELVRSREVGEHHRFRRGHVASGELAETLAKPDPAMADLGSNNWPCPLTPKLLAASRKNSELPGWLVCSPPCRCSDPRAPTAPPRRRLGREPGERRSAHGGHGPARRMPRPRCAPTRVRPRSAPRALVSAPGRMRIPTNSITQSGVFVRG